MNDRLSRARALTLRADVSDATMVVDERARGVLRNTWMLLGLNLAFSAAIAYLAMAAKWPAPGILLTLGGYFGLLFAVTKFRDSGVGVLLTFALTGFMGYTIGPLLNAVMALPGGSQTITLALGATAGVFLAMAGWATVTRRDLSGMGSFLFIGMVVAMLAGLGAIFFEIPALSLAVSAAVVLLMAGMIAFETQRIVRGGETNYVMATTSLFVSIFNLFTALLQLFGFAGSRD